jgi:tRNA threonylcarbamoyladenosine biosynthesis protein TsaB
VNILAFDTATEILSVALVAHEGSRRVSFSVTRDVGLHHARGLMPLVRSLLDEAGLAPGDLDLVACTRGPGSFTGLRIGMSTAKGLGMAVAGKRSLQNPPVISLPTLDIMAYPFSALPGVVVPVIDAKKGRFYCAVYRDGSKVTTDLDIQPAGIIAHLEALPGLVLAPDRQPAGVQSAVLVTGPHADRFVAALPGISLRLDPIARRGHARALLVCAERAYASNGADGLHQGPVYVRGSDAELSRREG